jgi:uncharacterized repeat protein (TIGR02543 family)
MFTTISPPTRSIFATFAPTINFIIPEGGTLSVLRGSENLTSGSIVRYGDVLNITAGTSVTGKQAVITVTGLSAGENDNEYAVSANRETAVTVTVTLEDVTVTPTEYAVTFDLNYDGAAAPGEIVVASGGTVNKPDDPQREDFDFGGWYTEPACETEYVFTAAVSGDFTLYARWVAEALYPVEMWLSTKMGRVGAVDYAEYPKIESLENYVNEPQKAYLIVKDQYGNFYNSFDVTYSCDGVSMLTYRDGSANNNIKYGVLLRGRTPVQTMLTMTPANPSYANLAVLIPVTVYPARARQVWTQAPDDGRDMSHQIVVENTKFALTEDGEVAYMSLGGNLYKVDVKTGENLWEYHDTVVENGKAVYFGEPHVGSDGNVYVTELHQPYQNGILKQASSADRRIYKISPEGTLLSVSAWSAAIDSIYMDGSYMFMMTVDGKLNRADNLLNKLWTEDIQPVSEPGNSAVYGENLYAAVGNVIYKIYRNGTKEAFYTYPETNAALELDSINANGHLLLQQHTADKYSVILVNMSGEKDWEYELKFDSKPYPYPGDTELMFGDFTAALGMSGEKVFIGTIVMDPDDARTSEKRLTGLDIESGAVVFETLFTDYNSKLGLHAPIVANQPGEIYWGTNQLNAFNPDGSLAWQFPTKPEEEFDLYTTPIQLYSPSKNLVIYTGDPNPPGPGNVFGIRAAQGIPQNGINVSITGGDAALPGAFKDLRIEVTNYRETTAAELEITLWDISAGQALSRTIFADTLAMGRQNVYDCGAMIPSSGNLKLIVNIKDAEGLTLYSKEIAVQQQ